MKHVIVLAIALFAGIANATSILPTVAKVDQVSMKVQSVSLFANGRLVAYTRDGKYQELKLAPSVSAELLNLSESVGQAELITTHQDVVCMMMVNPFMTRELSVLSSSGLRLTLSASGCAFPNHTHPKEEYVTNMANQLRDDLILLGKQALME